MRKRFCLALALIIVFSLVGCGMTNDNVFYDEIVLDNSADLENNALKEDTAVEIVEDNNKESGTNEIKEESDKDKKEESKATGNNEETETTPKTLEFKAMSYNVHYYNKNATNEQDIWRNRKKALIKRIINNNPDVFGTQEVSKTILDYFMAQLGDEYDYAGEFRDGTKLGEASFIFYKKDKFELLDTKTMWLSETPDKVSVGWDAALNRIVTYATFKDKESGIIFRHYNTHLDHKGTNARKESVKLIKSWISECEYPCILTGDFNFNETSANYGRVLEFMDDSKYVATISMDGYLTYNGYKDALNGIPIDYCFVSKDDFTIAEYKIDNTKIDGWFASDHYPVVVSLKLDSDEGEKNK